MTVESPGDICVIPFAFRPAVRRVIYTTNAIESVNARLRKIIKTRGHFPSDEVATKPIWLAPRCCPPRWSACSPSQQPSRADPSEHSP